MKKIILAAAIIFTMSGCATILNEDTQPINLTTSNGKSTTVNINGQLYDAPGIIHLKRSKEDALVVASSDNCKGSTVAPSKVDNVFFLNILSGGSFGSTTDYSSDDMWQYDTTIQVNCR